MRKFYLENEAKQRFSLWGNRVYMVDPSGLGIKHDATYIRIGKTFLRNQKLQVSQGEISGTIEFLEPGGNKRFKEFYDFCAAASSLHLIYDPGDGTEYIRDIDIGEVQKSERTGGTLPIKVKFLCKTLYYSAINNSFSFESVTDEKRYDYTYDFTYGDYGTYEAAIHNDGHVEAPFECVIYGYCVNPSIYIIQNDEVIYEAIFPVAVEQGDYLKYSSRDGMLEVTLVSDGKETNIMNLLDITKDNFFKIPVGDSKIVFTSGSSSTNIVTVTIYKMFEVV